MHRWLMVLLFLAACGQPVEPTPATEISEPEDPPPVIETEELTSPSTADLLPDEFERVWEPWTGDYNAIVQRRVLRVLTPYGGYQFYYDNGRPRGATWEMLVRLESWINEQLNLKNVRVYVVPIPVSRDQLIPGLIAGEGDLIATDLTITPEREDLVSFTRPLLADINEVVVLGPSAPDLGTLEDLAGQEIFVRPTSSYAEHLQGLGDKFLDKQIEPPTILPADELLEAEDLLDMMQAGVAGITIMDDYKAEFWSSVMDDIDVRGDLVVNEGGAIAWAHRKEDTELAAILEQFLRKYGKGSAFGNDVYKRHLQRPERARCSTSRDSHTRILPLIDLFRQYGEQYNFNWLMLAAQGYQESGLRQDRKSPAGAIGVMQIKPSTAADKNVGIDDITTAENNIHAGSKYMRFIADRYFSDPAINGLDQWFFALAAYNAGPAKINRYRREASEMGLDPNIWFDNVEIVAARRIGRETVTYVSNIFKYFLGYELAVQRDNEIDDRFGEVMTFCARSGT